MTSSFLFFLGTVVAVTDLPQADDQAFLSSRKARIRIDEAFGGLSPDLREVDVLTGRGGGDCGIGFQVGAVYLVAASLGNDGLVHAGICSETRRIDGDSSALRVLRQRRDGQEGPSLAGLIAQYDRNFEGILGMHSPKPLANTLVRVKAGGRVYEARSDGEGLYALYHLPAGKYDFIPELPPGTSLSWFIGSDRPLGSFELRAGSCQERDIEVFPSGSIQGRVLDSSNKLLPHAFVYVVPADLEVLPKERQLYWESQDKEGFFKFVHIPPGRYLILVNPDDKIDPAFPYRRTFYPGVSDRESASIITVGEGEHVEGADIRLERRFDPRHITVRVTWADGRLIQSFVSVSARPTDNPEAMAEERQPDLKASIIELTILPTETYKIQGEVTCRYSDDHSSGPGATLKSDEVYFGPKDDQTEIFLTIPGTACPDVPGKTLETAQ